VRVFRLVGKKPQAFNLISLLSNKRDEIMNDLYHGDT